MNPSEHTRKTHSNLSTLVRGKTVKPLVAGNFFKKQQKHQILNLQLAQKHQWFESFNFAAFWTCQVPLNSNRGASKSARICTDAALAQHRNPFGCGLVGVWHPFDFDFPGIFRSSKVFSLGFHIVSMGRAFVFQQRVCTYNTCF